MPINLAHLEYRLSGGAANADQNAALGGERSDERVFAQLVSGPINVSGVVIDYAAGNAAGVVLPVVGIERSDSTAVAEITGHAMTGGQRVRFQGADQAPYNIAVGVTVIDPDHVSFPVAGSPATPATGTITVDTSVGELDYVAASTSLQWTGPGGLAGDLIDVSDGGKFTLFSGANVGFLLIEVTPSELPATDETDSLVVQNIANELFDDVSKAESYAGDTEYRCIYIQNTHDADAFLDLISFIGAQPTPVVISIGLDPAGVGTGRVHNVVAITRSGTTATAEITGHGMPDGKLVKFAGADQSAYNITATIAVVDPDHVSYSVTGSPATPATGTITASSGVAVVTPNENTAPAGVTFSAPASSAVGLAIGALPAGNSVPLWVRRAIPLRNTVSNEQSQMQLATQAFY